MLALIGCRKAVVSTTSEKRSTIVESIGAAWRFVGAISSARGGAASSSWMPPSATTVQLKGSRSAWPDCDFTPKPPLGNVIT